MVRKSDNSCILAVLSADPSLFFTMSFFFFFFLGNHPCFSCKTVGQEVTRCSVSGCGCYYHEECVRKLPGATSSPGGGFCCPQHSCSTCCLERDLQRASKGRAAPDLPLGFSVRACRSNLYSFVLMCQDEALEKEMRRVAFVFLERLLEGEETDEVLFYILMTQTLLETSSSNSN